MKLIDLQYLVLGGYLFKSNMQRIYHNKKQLIDGVDMSSSSVDWYLSSILQ